MGNTHLAPELEPAAIREFTKALLADLHALEKIIELGMLDPSERRFGAEQEVFLVDRAWRPASIGSDVLERLGHGRFTTELGLFNAEVNADPIALGGDCLLRLEQELDADLRRLRSAAHQFGAEVVLTGILPSITKSDLSMDNMTPNPRYLALNEAMTRARGGPMRLHIAGADEIHIEHDSVMLEACNTSFQVHLQVRAREFAHFYNVAQVIAAPVMAASVNSPMLFGKRLWEETRIALFQQSVDTRSASPHLREMSPRVRFGEEWVRDSVVELFKDDIARFRVILAADVREDPFSVLAAGGVPALKALQLHNSTVYRWNRPCYGVGADGPHLRIEFRAFPSGPSLADEVANAAFWIGLMLGGTQEFGDVTEQMDFGDARANFIAAARQGAKGVFTWIGGKSYDAPDLILNQLLPLAAEGLRSASVDDVDVTRFLGIIGDRVASGRTGARWIIESASAMSQSPRGERLTALTAAIANRQWTGAPGHTWELARPADAAGWRPGSVSVEHYMSTDLFTVGEDESVEFSAFLMDQRRLRHVLVEDHEHQLVGIISYRSLIRLLARGGLASGQGTVTVKDVMEPNPITIPPETSTTRAIEVMREHQVSALPVCKDGKLVGLVTERTFMQVTADLLEQGLRDA